MSLADIVQGGWDALAAGDFDALVADYAQDMRFIMPGQADVLEGRQAFRRALDGVGQLLPPGFAISGLRHLQGADEVVSILEWRCDKLVASQLCVLFRFSGEKIVEERWFIDTEQWKAAF